jgi:uncharacterized protein YndB with AHSA1/START domain
MNANARSIADVASRTILAVTDVAVPPERLFRALSSPEVAEWWGEEGVYRTTEWSGDVRVGGRWRAVGVGADGTEFSVVGEFVEIDAPRRISFTWQPSWSPGQSTVVHYRLDPIEGGTRLTLRHDGFTSPDACQGHSNGWLRVFGWLSGHVEDAARRPVYFLIRLLPPRPTFMRTMTSAERDLMREHTGYWTKLMQDGTAVAFGPVADPNGGWGVSVVEVNGPGAVSGLIASDPAKLSGLGFRYEVLPMLRAVVRPR